MLHLAAVFQKAGLVVPLIVFSLICVSSTGAAQLLCDSIARMPGNDNLEVRIEYSEAFRHYLGDRSAIASQVIFFCGIFTQTVASIIGTAQSMDGLIVLMFDKTWALQVGASPGQRFVTWTPEEYCGTLHNKSQCVPFSTLSPEAPEIGVIISTGYICTLLLLAPLGFWNLDDNIKFQILSFFILLVLSLEFCVNVVAQHGLHPELIPLFGDDYSSVLGTIMFNFAFCPTLPSWLNEKKSEVRVGRVLWTSAGTATAMYIIVGILIALSFNHAGENVLQILSAGQVWPATKICAFLFGILVVGLGIPVFCIVLRYNLLVAGKFSNFTSTMLGVVLPWAISWLLYQGSAAEVFINVSGVVLISAAGFIAPLLVALAASGMTLVGAGSSMELLRRLCAKATLSESSCAALPRSWLPWQRRYVGILLAMLVPLVLAGIVLQILEMAEGSGS